jgi:hypothetical protein
MSNDQEMYEGYAVQIDNKGQKYILPGGPMGGGFPKFLPGHGSNPKKTTMQEIQDSTTAQDAADAYWAKQKEESDARATGKPDSFQTDAYAAGNQSLLDLEAIYNRSYGGKGGVVDQVNSAYGAASARGAEGVKNIYSEGQRAASAIDTLYGGAAARAQGAAASSGTSPVSGDAVYTPTTNRAYGSTIADYTGSASTISARNLSNSNASRSGSGRVNINDWVKNSMLEMKTSLNYAYDLASRNAKSAKEQEAINFGKQKADDKLDTVANTGLLDFVRNYWHAKDDPNNPKVKETRERIRNTYNGNEELYLAALEKYIAADSRKTLLDFINQPTLFDEMGNLK